jgi:hypothetical protein
MQPGEPIACEIYASCSISRGDWLLQQLRNVLNGELGPEALKNVHAAHCTAQIRRNKGIGFVDIAVHPEDRFLDFPIIVEVTGETEAASPQFVSAVEVIVDLLQSNGIECVVVSYFEDQLRNKGWHYKT